MKTHVKPYDDSSFPSQGAWQLYYAKFMLSMLLLMLYIVDNNFDCYKKLRFRRSSTSTYLQQKNCSITIHYFKF